MDCPVAYTNESSKPVRRGCHNARAGVLDAPVTRVEIGGGYSIQRNPLLKLSSNTTRATPETCAPSAWSPGSCMSGSSRA